MNDLESALNSILGSPEQMERIMGIARSFSEGGNGPNTGENEPDHKPPPSGFGGLGDLDPRMLGMITRIMGEYTAQSSEKAALIAAMRPFLREDRYQSLNKALTITKIARAARTALAETGGEKLV